MALRELKTMADLLRAKFFGFEPFDFDKRAKSELYTEVLGNFVIRRFL